MNTFISGFSKGISDYGRALSFIFKHRLSWTFLVPIGLNVLLLIGGWTLMNELTKDLSSFLNTFFQFNDADFWGVDALRWLISGVVWLIFKIVFFFVFAYLGGYIVLMLMSPFLAYLSERSETLINQKKYNFDAEQLVRDIFRAILIAVRNLFAELLIIFLIFLIGFIPLIGWVVALASPILLLLVSAYFYGFSFTDYFIERRRYKVKQSIAFMKSHRGIITGNGLPFALVLLIPFIGVGLSGFVAIISVVASVISLNDVEQQERSSSAENIQAKILTD